MKYAFGNEKLGKKCIVISRPVGLTCPSDCFFLNNGCYAQLTEKRFPNSRKAAEHNLTLESNELFEVLKLAAEKGYPIRIHERGDFLINDRVDWDYLKSWRQAINKFNKVVGQELPSIWCYTHAYYKSVAKLADLGINIYASVHNQDDYDRAEKAGFKLFAFCSTFKKKKGGSNKIDKYLNTDFGRMLVCPEQRLGRKKVTCDLCKFCIKGRGNILFLEH